MLDEHRAGVGAGDDCAELVGDFPIGRKVAVDVGSAEHAFFGGDVGVVAPGFGLFIAAALQRHAGLHVEMV